MPGHPQTNHMSIDHHNSQSIPYMKKQNHTRNRLDFDSHKRRHIRAASGNRTTGKSQTLIAGRNPANVRMTKQQARQHVDDLRQRYNQELLTLLEEEQRLEEARESKLQSITDQAELQRLEKIMGIERAQASERIILTSNQHEQIILREMKRLNLVQ